MCDTADQIEQVFTLHAEEAIEFDEAINAVNLRAGESKACSKATVDAILIEEVRNIKLRGIPYTVVKLAVTGVSDGKRMLPVPSLEQFAMMAGEERHGA